MKIEMQQNRLERSNCLKNESRPTYFSSSIWMAWYQPIPRLGAPQPTRMTSAWPSLAELSAFPPKDRFTIFRLTKPAALRVAIENMMIEMTVWITVAFDMLWEKGWWSSQYPKSSWKTCNQLVLYVLFFLRGVGKNLWTFLTFTFWGSISQTIYFIFIFLPPEFYSAKNDAKQIFVLSFSSRRLFLWTTSRRLVSYGWPTDHRHSDVTNKRRRKSLQYYLGTCRLPILKVSNSLPFLFR